ncbi:MAG: CmcJ/NvfI family oxidoreductase [Pseudomonadota bacterium]
MSASRLDTQPPSRAGEFNYLSAETASSLFRNGEVLTRRDLDGSDGGVVGVYPRSYTVDVFDARGLIDGERKSCERNGFELIDAHAPAVEFFDHDDVIRRYYPDCEALVAASTGGRAFAFDHNLRSAQGKANSTRIAGGQTVQGPAKMVHGDYTLTSAPQRLQDLSRPPGQNDTLRGVLGDRALISAQAAETALAADGRFAIINVWRSIAAEPVQLNPLAMCDGQTVVPDDLVTFEIHYADRIGENYFAKHAPAHAFFFFPEMTRGEVLLLKQWDSAGPLARSAGAVGDASPDAPCTFSFHSAFDDPSVADDAPDRLSIEVRCLVLYD